MASGIHTVHYNECKRIYLERIKTNPDIRKLPVFTREAVKKKIKELIDSPSTSHYLQVITEGGLPKLLLKTRRPYKIIISIEDAFDVVLETHIQHNHANSWLTFQELSKTYSLPMICVTLVVDLCYVCHPNVITIPEGSVNDRKLTVKNGIKRGVWRMNIIRDSILTSCDKHCRSKFLLIYKENSTNFVVLRPLFKSAAELSLDIFQLFVEFGYPKMVLVPNMIEFYKAIFRMVYAINPINEIPVHELAFNATFEDDKKEILLQLDDWKQSTENMYWDQGCLIVQYKMNNTSKFITRIESDEKYWGIPFNLFYNVKSDASIETSKSTTENDNEMEGTSQD